MANQALDAALTRLCEGYGRVFSYRNRAAPEAVRFHQLNLVDAERVKAEYARFEYDKTDRFLERFPHPPTLEGRVAVDLGCRNGGGPVRMAVRGAVQAIGLDLGEVDFAPGRDLAREHGVEGRVDFRVSSETALPVASASVDLVTSEDVIEHLSVPEAIFFEIRRILRPGGRLYARFGPPWYHPQGVHLWGVLPGPWTHVIFPERIVCNVRHRGKRDGGHGQRFQDLGLNQMSVRRFRQLLKWSGLEVEHLHVNGIRGADFLTRVPGLGEFVSSEVEVVARRPEE